MLLPFPNPAKVNIHNRAKSDRCLPFLFQFSSCLAGLAVYSIIQFSRHKYLLSGPKFRAARLRDSGDPSSGSGSVALVTIFSLIREKWSPGLTPGPHNCNAHQSEGRVWIFKYNLQMQVEGALFASYLQTLLL